MDLLHTHSKAPVLYIAPGSKYAPNGVLMQEECTRIQLWRELIQKNEIKKVLLQWKQRQSNDRVEINIHNIVEIIVPFRMVIHKLEKLKMVYSKQNGHKGSCNSKHFALLWVPTHRNIGLNENEYKQLITAMESSLYFCNKLNKDCIYISGPEYGHLEHPDEEKIDYDHVFDLEELGRKCRLIGSDRLPTTKTLDIEIAVHELANECSAEPDEDINVVNVANGSHLLPQSSHSSSSSSDYIPSTEAPLLSQISMHRKAQIKSFGSNFEGGVGPLPTGGFEAIYEKESALKRKHFVFALVWLHVKDKKHLFGSCDIDTKEVQIDRDQHTQYANDPFVLPAWSIMKKLHQQPYKRSLVYTVELFNYAECWENQDLVVDRKILWKEAFLLLLQFYLLPLFAVIPLIQFVHITNPDFNLKPRYRPVSEDEYIEFYDLDLIEQIPYDISALWGGTHEYKKRRILKRCCFRLLSFILTSVIWGIVFIGPSLYSWKPSQVNDIESFLFFDCLGPLIFYHLAAFTIIWWSCATRIYIWPKEHELLYFKLIVNRPIRRKDKGNRNIRRTDWAALENISCATILSTFLYSYRKGFLELKTPNHELLSLRPIKVGTCRVFITAFINIILYFLANNLENIQVTGLPWHISKNEAHYVFKLVYNISSQLLSMIFLFCFILLWETMFNRICRHLHTIKVLRMLLTRNTYSEYIRLSKTDNILSWMIMERFIKRKGMMLFSSLEAPLFALAFLSVLSWAGTIYAFYEGVGQKLFNESSTFSNSALATWVYLALFAFYQTGRMLFGYGRKFTQETELIESAFKRSCKTLHIENLMEYEVNRCNTLDQKYAIRSSQYILSHSNYDEIVPKVFGIQFDKLTAKAVWGLCISTFPTILKVMTQTFTDRLSVNF